jgi:hypothetical protein
MTAGTARRAAKRAAKEAERHQARAKLFDEYADWCRKETERIFKQLGRA